MAHGPKKRWRGGFAMFAGIILLAPVLLPAIFGNRMIVSPVLLFGIVIICNLANCMIPNTSEEGNDSIFSKIFFLRLGLSIVFSAFIIAAYLFAIRF